MAAPLALDAPRDLAGRVWVWRGAVFLVCAALVAAIVPWASTDLAAIPSVGLLQAVIGALVSMITAVLMVDHARVTGHRGFLAVAITYLYLACILAVFPFAFPGSFVADAALMGSAQTPVGLFFAWHFAVPVGLCVATVLLYLDEQRHRRPSLTTGQIRLSIAACLLGVAITVALALMWSLLGLPPMLAAGGVLTGFSSGLKAASLVLSLTFLGIAAYCARNGSVILGWLGATAVLGAAESIISFASIQRYSLGWYASRVMWLVAVSVLLLALIRSLSRVADANVALGAVDSLTGVASRAAFVRTLTREIGRSQIDDEKIALLWINLDQFKEVNDQLGQEAGDEVLRRIATRIGKRLGPGDAIGRLGGDQFGVLLADQPDQQTAVASADALLAALRRPITLPEATVHVTAAIGVALSGRDATSADGLLQCADLAVGAAKRLSGDRSVGFDQALGADDLARKRICRDLVDGLRNQEFSLFYQPIYELSDLRMAGVEALARWRRDGSVLPAGQWIPVAESTGQIVAVAHQLLACLVSDLPAWVADRGDAGFFVTMNVSSYELGDEAYVDALLAALAPHVQHVLIEVTESLEMQERSAAGENLERLRAAGLRLAIDDFGTGYSNLSRLQRLRPTLMKTDRSLVNRVGSDVAAGAALLESACTLARMLECDVVVEGVETQGEAKAAAAVGAKYVQGFLYGRPAPMQRWLGADALSPAAPLQTPRVIG